MNKQLIAVLAGVVAIVGTAAGCGGGGSSSLSKAEFIAKANAICKAGSKEISEGTEKFVKENHVNTRSPTKAQKEELIVQLVAPGVLKQGEEIGDLGAPQGDEGTVETMVKAVEEGAKQLGENPGQLGEGKEPLARASKLAKEYGLTECGNG